MSAEVTRLVSGAFAGRDRQLSSFVRRVRDTLRRGGGIVVLHGEAGIGKTQVLERGLAELTGHHVLWLRPDELAAGIPYAALAVACAELAASAPAAARRAPARAVVAAIDDPVDPSVARVHAAVARLISTLRDDAPTLVVVDDLHALDDDTAGLLATLLRRPERHPVVLVGALRPLGPDTPAGVWDLLHRAEHRPGRVAYEEVPPLDRAALGDVLGALLDAPPHEDLVDAVLEQSGGNPFFVVQTLTDLVERRLVQRSGESAAVSPAEPLRLTSPSRRQALVHRVLRVGPAGRRVAQAVALLGSVSTAMLDLVAELAGVEPDQARGAFDGLVRSNILHPSGPGVFRFSHQLLRDSIYDELGPADRWRLHRLAAEHLATLPASVERDKSLALHVRESADYGDAFSIRVLRRQADTACRLAPASAISWYEHALSITPPTDPEHRELTYRLGRAVYLAGRAADAVDILRQELAAHPTSPVGDRARSLLVDAMTEISQVEEAAELMASHGDRRGPGDLRRAAQAAYVFALAGRDEAAHRAAGRVERGLAGAGPAEQVGALVHLAHMANVSGRPQLLDRTCRELRSSAARAPEASRLNGFAAMSYVLASQGRTRACSEAIAEAAELLVSSGLDLYRAELSVAQARHAINVGDWDAALAIADSVIPELEAVGAATHLAGLRAAKIVLLANRGDWPPARAAAREDAGGDPMAAVTHGLAVAELDRLSGRLDLARRRVTDEAARDSLPGGIRAIALAVLADLHADAGAPDDVAAVAEAVEGLGLEGVDPVSEILLVSARGRARGDVGLLAAARARAGEHGLVLHRGRCDLFLAEAGEDPEANLLAAIRTFQELEAGPWRRRAAAGFRRLGLKVPRHRPTGPELLTETETQIARLVQLGRPNREIAAAVSLSVKTVEAYLSRIYLKTGFTTRLELARALDLGQVQQATGR